jgi:hypothetical protein
VTSAYIDMTWLLELRGAIPAASSHPSSGLRRETDGMLDIIQDVIGPVGKEPTRFAGEELPDAKAVIEQRGDIFGTADESRLTAEVPFESNTALLTMFNQEPHPRLGNGLHVVLTPPMRCDMKGRGLRAIEWNTQERTAWTGAPMIGSWCPHPTLENFMAFVSFIPNYAHIAGLATTLAMYATRRSMWLEQEMPTLRGATS